MNPGSVPKRSRTSCGLRRPRRRAERVLELDLVEPVVAAHQHQHRPASSTIIGSALISAPAGTPSIAATASIVVAPGVSTGSGAGQRLGQPSTGCGVALAISTLAA